MAIKYQRSWQDRLGQALFYTIIAAIFVVIVYPLWFVVIASFSHPDAVANGEVWLLPVRFNLEGYKAIMKETQLWTGYRNTIFYTTVGTMISLAVTIPAGYALSRPEFMPRKVLNFFFIFTMFFSGGLIPTFLVINKLHMVNTIWVMLIPFCLNVYNLTITRSFFQSSIPKELQEAADIDGCGEIRFFFSIVLPLSKAVLAVIALYYAVASWNNYFTPMIYLRDSELQTLQVYLRSVLMYNETLGAAAMDGVDSIQNLTDMIKYGVIVVSSVPMLILYPFVQKYFVKGVMIGAIKG